MQNNNYATVTRTLFFPGLAFLPVRVSAIGLAANKENARIGGDITAFADIKSEAQLGRNRSGAEHVHCTGPD